jgi:hypothetical protein
MGRNGRETWEDERESRLEKGETCATAVSLFQGTTGE